MGDHERVDHLWSEFDLHVSHGLREELHLVGFFKGFDRMGKQVVYY